MGKWGGYHTEFAHLARGFAGNERALAEAVGEALLAAGLLAEKPSVGQRHVFLNPRRARRHPRARSSGERRRAICGCHSFQVAHERPVPGHQKLFTARTLAETGILRPTRPDKALRIANALRRWGPTPAAGYTASAIRDPDGTAIIDELGTLTFEEVHRRTNALAHSLSDAGVKEGDAVAIMIRNHRGFIDATVACSKLGAHALYLNTAFAGPQITEVVKREKPVALIYDAEFEGLTHDAGAAAQALHRLARRRRRSRRTRCSRTSSRPATPTTSSPPENKGRVVILTSGTTGSPKGAQRKQPESLDPAAALFSKIPLRAGEPTMIAAPMFHSWGFVHFTLGMGLGSTLVLRRRFDPEDTLSATAQHECTALVVVPVMLSRIMELPAETIDMLRPRRPARDRAPAAARCPASWRVQGHGPLRRRPLQPLRLDRGRVGDDRHPRGPARRAGHRRAPAARDRGQAGRRGGQRGRPRARPGGSSSATRWPSRATPAAASKQNIGGLLSSGDVGHFDSGGRLFIDGRDDEMIVSGGENVFPREVEDLLAEHDGRRRGGRHRRRRRAVRPAPEGLRRASRAAPRSTPRTSSRTYVKANLARYKVPREIEFLDELPRNATGKVLKRELAERE